MSWKYKQSRVKLYQ